MMKRVRPAPAKGNHSKDDFHAKDVVQRDDQFGKRQLQKREGCLSRRRHCQVSIFLLTLLFFIGSIMIMSTAMTHGTMQLLPEQELDQSNKKDSNEIVHTTKLIHDTVQLPAEKVLDQSNKKDSNEIVHATKLEEAIAELVTANEISKSSSDYMSLNLLQNHSPPEVYGEAITNEQEEHDRCKRYGLKYNATLQNTRRRIFYGSMIADESIQTIATHAAEAYGLYHTVALIQSNITHTGTPRDVLYPPGSPKLKLLKSMFGQKTSVDVDLYYEDTAGSESEQMQDMLLREDLQRELVLKSWKKNGMTAEDIGVMGDVDEMFTRDFLLASQTCDVPEFRHGQDCRSPKVVASTVIFESSPECIISNYKWFHPDMVIGECIDGIGSAEGRATPKRVSFNGMEGRREDGHGRHQRDYKELPKIDLYALWKPTDMRITEGGQLYQENKGGHTAYHLHNYFNSLKDLRHKYATYTHPVNGAESVPLGRLHEDVNNVLLCMMNRTLPEDITGKYASRTMEKNGFDGFDGRKPVIYNNAEYRKVRHEEFRKEIEEDEAKYGIFNYEGEPRKEVIKT